MRRCKTTSKFRISNIILDLFWTSYDHIEACACYHVVKNADKGLQKLVPLGTISNAYAFTWANLGNNVKLFVLYKMAFLDFFFRKISKNSKFLHSLISLTPKLQN